MPSSPSRITGPTGFASMSVLPPEPRELTIPELKTKLVARLEEKCGRKTMRWRLQHAFHDVDLDERGVVSLPQWVRITELLGCARDMREATRLFVFFDTADGQREQSGVISQEVVVVDLLACRMGGREESIFAKHGGLDAGPAPGSKSKGNLPSHPGGVFAGGAYEEEWTQHPSWQNPDAKRSPPAVRPAPSAASAAAKGGNVSNISSVEGGIFAAPEGGAPTHPPRKTGPCSNNSSVPGGIFAAPVGMMAPSYDPGKKNSNQSSIPGGLFAPSTAMRRLGGA